MKPLTSPDALALLDVMRGDMAHQPTRYQPTPFWSAASERIIAELRRDGFDGFRHLEQPRQFFVPSYGPPGNLLSPDDLTELEATLLRSTPSGGKKHQTLLDLLSGQAWGLADYRVFLAGDRPEISPNLSRVTESEIGAPRDALVVDGRRFSRSMLNYLHGLVYLKQRLGDVGIRTVLEIGGGFGTLGEILLQAGPDHTYIDVDIPPTSAVASYYLSHLPNQALVPFAETRGDGPIPVPGPGRQLVLCPWQLPRLTGQVDLVWNFISFQEMEPEVVADYLTHAARLNARYVLLRNLREGKQRRTEQNPVGVLRPILGSDYDAFLPGYRLVDTNVHPFGFRTIDGFHSELRLYQRR